MRKLWGPPTDWEPNHPLDGMIRSQTSALNPVTQAGSRLSAAGREIDEMHRVATSRSDVMDVRDQPANPVLLWLVATIGITHSARGEGPVEAVRLRGERRHETQRIAAR